PRYAKKAGHSWGRVACVGEVLRGGGKTRFTCSAASCWPSGSVQERASRCHRWCWSSSEHPHDDSSRGRRKSCSTPPAYPCPVRSDKSCAPECCAVMPGTGSQSSRGAG